MTSNNLEKETEMTPLKLTSWVLRLSPREKRVLSMQPRSELLNMTFPRHLLALMISTESLMTRHSPSRIKRLLWSTLRANWWNLNLSRLATKRNWNIFAPLMNVIDKRTLISREESTKKTWETLSSQDSSRTMKLRSEWEKTRLCSSEKSLKTLGTITHPFLTIMPTSRLRSMPFITILECCSCRTRT